MYSTQTTAQLTKEYRPKLNHRCSRAGLKKLFTTKPERGFVTPDPIKHNVELSLTLRENHCQAVAAKSSHYCNIIGSCKQVYYLVKPVDHNAKSIPSCCNVLKNLVDHITELNSHEISNNWAIVSAANLVQCCLICWIKIFTDDLGKSPRGKSRKLR